VREIAGSKSEIVFVPYEKAYEQGFEDMPRRVPDTNKIKNLIGWQPTIALPQILSDVVEFQRRGG
jgi:UDP-glucose 4-epimerase